MFFQLLYLFLVRYSEPLLFVYYQQAQILEFDVAGQQSVRACDIHRSLFQLFDYFFCSAGVLDVTSIISTLKISRMLSV